jgi:hypothetical protein
MSLPSYRDVRLGHPEIHNPADLMERCLLVWNAMCHVAQDDDAWMVLWGIYCQHERELAERLGCSKRYTSPETSEVEYALVS